MPPMTLQESLEDWRKKTEIPSHSYHVAPEQGLSLIAELVFLASFGIFRNGPSPHLRGITPFGQCPLLRSLSASSLGPFSSSQGGRIQFSEIWIPICATSLLNLLFLVIPISPLCSPGSRNGGCFLNFLYLCYFHILAFSVLPPFFNNFLY